MVDWYLNLTPQEQAVVQGAIIALLFGVVKAALHYAGRPLSQDAGGKVRKLLAVAVLSVLGTLATHGWTEQFWPQAVMAFCAAVGTWEAASKAYNLTQPEEE